MKILIAGSKGMLGSECTNVLQQEHEVIAPERKDFDITSWDVVIEKLQEVLPDVVLNCAGFTDMEACETEEFAVRKINVEGPRNLAQCCARYECKLIHVSSDCIFDGSKLFPQPYFEDDSPNPLSAYGASKIQSEVAVRENSPNYIIVRTGWLYGINGNHFISSLLEQAVGKKQKVLKFAEDQYGSPTWAYRLALQISELLKEDGRGTYHATAEGFCSRSEFAAYVLKRLKVKATIEPFSLDDSGAIVSTPANCILENRLLKKQGICIMRDWKEDVDVFLGTFGDILKKRAKAVQSS